MDPRTYIFRASTYGMIRRWLRRWRVPVRVHDDVAQVAMTEAFASLDTFDPGLGRPSHWLRRIAYHAWTHERDRAVHRREVHGEVDVASDDDPDEQLARATERARVYAALTRIEERGAGIVLDHDLDGIPMRDVAAALGIAMSTAYRHRDQALRELGVELLQERGGT